jgi:uncharacterized protein (DUF849 family)
VSARRKVIITCAVTGSIHTPSMSPHLPITPEQILRESLAAAEAGAAVLHLHARDPEDGHPSSDPEIFERFLPELAASTDAVLNLTTSGRDFSESANLQVERTLDLLHGNCTATHPVQQATTYLAWKRQHSGL